MTTTTQDTTDSMGRTYELHQPGLRYRLSGSRRGSSSLGPCEICKKNADEVFIQTEQRRLEDEDGGFWYNCGYSFGHPDCLRQAR